MVKAIAKAESWKQAHQIEAQYVDQFRRILGNSLYSERNEEIWVTAARYLMEQKITIASAESCTGGLFGAYLTKNPGISASYRGGVISYDNGIKEKILGVSHQTLSDYGAVSEQTAREMANGVRPVLQRISVSALPELQDRVEKLPKNRSVWFISVST
jgi:nicotinamide-nucleotide amidase